MIGRVAKMFAYVKAPVKTFAAFHPLRFVKYALFLWVGKKLWGWVSGDGRRTRRERRLAARSGRGARTV